MRVRPWKTLEEGPRDAGSTRPLILIFLLIPLYPHTLIPLYPYTLTPLHPYTLIPLYPYTLIPLLGGDCRLTMWFVRPQNAREAKVDSKRRTRTRSKEKTNERPSEQEFNAKTIENRPQNRPQIDEKSMQNRSWAPWGRFGAIGGAPGTLRGRFGSAPGRSWDVLGRPQGPPGTFLKGCWLAWGRSRDVPRTCRHIPGTPGVRPSMRPQSLPELARTRLQMSRRQASEK